jgi:hypothetical protein
MPDLSRDISKWQAVSHSELADRRPDELFDAGFSERYSELHRLLWERLLRLHGTLRTLEELDQFPFSSLYAPDDMSFWVLVVENFRDMYCVTLNTLVEDSGDDVHTLTRFKNEIRRANWLEPKLIKDFDKTLADCRFDDEVKSIARRMKAIRDHRVAHQLVDHAKGGLLGVMEGVSLEEQRRLFDAVHSLFGALSFGAAYVTLMGDLMPSSVRGKTKPSCLDGVLDAVL